MDEFCSRIADILDVPAVAEGDVLRDFEEWDSLSVLTVIAMLDAQYGLNVTALQLKDVRTVADLWALTQSKRRA